MKTCVISDMHGFLPEIDPCELVLICGDSVDLRFQNHFKGCYKWYDKIFKPWAEALPCNKVLFIAGNHDCGIENHEETFEKLFPRDGKITFINHNLYEYISLDGKAYSIFGSPYCKVFGNWAYMMEPETLKVLFDEIPRGLDILFTHDVPYGYADVIEQEVWWNTGEHIGNPQLVEAILDKQPRYHFSGHLHSCTHDLVMINNTRHYNTSIKDERYQPVYKPLYIEIE